MRVHIAIIILLHAANMAGACEPEQWNDYRGRTIPTEQSDIDRFKAEIANKAGRSNVIIVDIGRAVSGDVRGNRVIVMTKDGIIRDVLCE